MLSPHSKKLLYGTLSAHVYMSVEGNMQNNEGTKQGNKEKLLTTASTQRLELTWRY
jgi:hypothetical protein